MTLDEFLTILLSFLLGVGIAMIWVLVYNKNLPVSDSQQHLIKYKIEACEKDIPRSQNCGIIKIEVGVLPTK